MKVTTIKGEEILKKDARRIKMENGEFGYYKVGNPEKENSGDCYKINNIFYSIDKGRIAWDNYLKSYVLKSTLQEGIIDTNFKVGYFSATAPVVYICRSMGMRELCMTVDIPNALKYIQGANGFYYNSEKFTHKQLYPRARITTEYKNSLDYNFKNYLETCKKNYTGFKPVSSDEVEYLYGSCRHIVDKFSFGVELETTAGMIPESVYKNLGVMPVRDGSIAGLEYVTIPLSGKKGLYAFKEIVEAIIKYTDSDYTCSMHVHVGNVPRTMEFIVAMFKMAYFIQDEVYPLFPRYKQYNEGVKRQCYTAPLDSFLMTSLNSKATDPNKVKEDYQRILYVLSGSNSAYSGFVDLDNIKGHPSDPNESAKWHMKERYKWLNLIPLVFTNKQTIEYRMFTVPDTVEKAMSFLLLSLMITEAAIVNTPTILQKPALMKGTELNIIGDYARVGTVVKYMMRDRIQAVSNYINNKGGFFEENQIVLPERVFRKPKVSVEKKMSSFYDSSYNINPFVSDFSTIRSASTVAFGENVSGENVQSEAERRAAERINRRRRTLGGV